MCIAAFSIKQQMKGWGTSQSITEEMQNGDKRIWSYTEGVGVWAGLWGAMEVPQGPRGDRKFLGSGSVNVRYYMRYAPSYTPWGMHVAAVVSTDSILSRDTWHVWIRKFLNLHSIDTIVWSEFWLFYSNTLTFMIMMTLSNVCQKKSCCFDLRPFNSIQPW